MSNATDHRTLSQHLVTLPEALGILRRAGHTTDTVDCGDRIEVYADGQHAFDTSAESVYISGRYVVATLNDLAD